MNLTLDQYATLFNISGILIVLGLSLAPLRLLSSTFFRAWWFAYLWSLLVIVIEFTASLVGRDGGISYLSVSAITLAALLVANTARSVRGEAFQPKRIAMVWALVSLVAFLSLSQGLAFLQVAVIPALGLSGAFIWLGVEVFRSRSTTGRRGAAWLAIPLIALGVWLLTYPLVMNSAAPWVGYWVSGLLNLWVGVGMMVYLLLQMTEDLQRSNAELRTLDDLKNNFLSTISHEVRTPLTAIRAAASLLGMGTPVDQDRFKAMVESNAVHLDRLLRDILDFAQMEAKVFTFELEDLDLGDVAVEARDTFTPIMLQSELAFDVEIPEEEIPVRADHDRLLQVLSNLLSNAAKFTPAGGAVSLHLRTVDGVACVTVRDNGPGIPTEALTRVFDKFYQVQSGDSRSKGGAGLGLAITKTIVQDGLKGTIRAENVKGGGSEFVVELRLVKAAVV